MQFPSTKPTRRLAVTMAISLMAGACASTAKPIAVQSRVQSALTLDPVTAQRYAAIETEKFPVAAVPVEVIKPRNVRQLVDYSTTHEPGTVVVDPHNRFLYLVQAGGKALRYGVGVGREGLEFQGTATVARKAQWPRWTPTSDMVKREPERYRKWEGGMEGSDKNPLGARALYLFKGGKDTLYRIHGTTEPDTIGEAVSSGCIRMMNQDVIDLYGRVPTGSKVVVL